MVHVLFSGNQAEFMGIACGSGTWRCKYEMGRCFIFSNIVLKSSSGWGVEWLG
jgi:hypothetical protein